MPGNPRDLPVLLWAEPRPWPPRRHGRGRGNHRRPEHRGARNAAHDAHVSHGGIAGLDITSGLPRVEELFEARVPKGQAIISEIDGAVTVDRTQEPRRIKVTSTETYHDEQPLPDGAELLVAPGTEVDIDQAILRVGDQTIPARLVASSRSRMVGW